MREVWKFKIGFGSTVVTMPWGATVIHVETQHNEPQMWAYVDPDEPRQEHRRFFTVGTGHRFPAGGLTHIGTFLLDGGDFVFHVFEVAP